MYYLKLFLLIIFSSSDHQMELCKAKRFPDGGLQSFELCKNKGLERRFREKNLHFSLF